MGNKSVTQIVRISDIVMKLSTDCTLTLKDVKHISRFEDELVCDECS